MEEETLVWLNKFAGPDIIKNHDKVIEHSL